MSEDVEPEIGSPTKVVRKYVGKGWRDMKSIYYANTLSWRVMKSGALVFMGFFLWAGSNVLLSYHEKWTFLLYPMAYGFVLIPYGPFTHIVMVPLTIRLRRKGSSIGRHLTKINFSVFLVLVVVAGTFPPGVMVFDFESAVGGSDDIDPELLCTKSTKKGEATIHCHLSSSRGISSIAVETSGRRIAVDDEPPFHFDVNASELESVVGQKQFQVVLRDSEGDTIRRYTRTLSMIG
ncbi:MAG: hypothetical protein SV760_03210 [Halobacteria archaeon]|nr:hypothetical protein [Halobacteria archaeon]